jgi:lysophospholipase L1-like esterase
VTVGIVGVALLPSDQPVQAAPASAIPTLSTPTPEAPKLHLPLSAPDIKAFVTSRDALTISVLGDSTGDEPGEWVDLWAHHLADAGRTVKFFQFDASKNAYPQDPVVLGSGPKTVAIWNGSVFGSTGTYAIARLGAMQPQRPDLIVYSYGHNNTKTTVVADLQTLKEKTDARWGGLPYAVTFQNPARGTRQAPSAASVALLRDWVSQTGAASIDVPAAYGDMPLGSLLKDEVHPNPQGERIWVDTVISALG